MKNFSKTIAAFSLSLLAIGATAQVQSNSVVTSVRSSEIRKAVGPMLNTSHPRHSASVNTISMQVFYPNTDGNIFGNAYSVNGLSAWSIDQINGRFDLADTNTHLVPRQNFNLITSASVSFDTILDGTDIGYSAQSAHLSVDTVWALVGYKNTSGNNDSLVFSINQVDAHGVPTTTSYTSVTLPLYKDVMFGSDRISGLDLDSLHYVYAVTHYTIPSGAKFCVNVTFHGNKADTFELAYGFPYSTCSPYNYANTFTNCGFRYKDTRTIQVNSYAWMFQEYFGSTTMQPAANGTILQFYMANNYEWNTCPSASTDTMFFYEQDYAIAASITFNNTTGIDNVAATNGLTVSQNYPNPFNKATTINYSLTKSSDVTFTVYDITGRVITTTNYGNVAPGQYQVNLNGNTFSPGIYFYTFNVNGNVITKKMIITE